MMMSPSAISNSYYTRVGISEEERTAIENRSEHLLLSDYTAKASGQNLVETLSPLPIELVNGRSYRVSLGNIFPEENAPEEVSVILYNKTIGDIAQQRLFDWQYNSVEQNWQWTFTVPANDESEEFELYISSGLFRTEGNPIINISDISVTILE